MNLNFKNRIAFHYMIATAMMMAVVFGAIYFIVHETVMSNIDNDLSYEAEKHTGEIKIVGDSLLFKNKAEWVEREHRETQVNPVFIQLIDEQGNLMDKSPNLKASYLPFNTSKFGGHFEEQLNNIVIRQVQLPVEQNGKIKGYILAAMSLESAKSVLVRLRNVLIISFLIVLGGLYSASRFIAGRSIRPIQEVTNTISRITKYNLKERVALPNSRDEIYELSANFNALVERIENAIAREKQFTSDASHELRTPLATLRGTLEVLIRKPRSREEYEEKIRYSLSEIERMTATLEQLLLLARLDNSKNHGKDTQIEVSTLVHESLAQFKNQIAEKQIAVNLQVDSAQNALIHHYYGKIIVENVLSNSIKYSHTGSAINIMIAMAENRLACTIQDQGVGIKEKDLDQIFNSFFRSDALSQKHITGNGLGLAIAKKCADAIGAELKVSSTYGTGTKVLILF